MKKFCTFLCLVKLLTCNMVFSEVLVPHENKIKGEIPAFENVDSLSQKILEAITSGNLEIAQDEFFPLEPFKNLKAIAKPEDYHKTLTKWYVADLKKEHEKFSGKKLVYSSFKKGYCKWKDVNTEANKIAYWSCYKNKIIAKDEAQKEVVIELRALINWGKEWKITHLGPIPK